MSNELWQRFKKYHLYHPKFDFAVDISRVRFSDKWLKNFKDKFKAASLAMAQLEKGAIANPDEKRMVGHYWLRNAALAPERSMTNEIQATLKSINAFTAEVLAGKVKGQNGPFENLLLVGIGGSALGPQFLDHALRPAQRGLHCHFMDNTDPDGIDRVLNGLGPKLGRTLVVVISKSGGTKETRNGMLETAEAYRRHKLSFAKHAVAVTSDGSALHKVATGEGWIGTFPMWDWVGGRTSVMSAVGLLPMSLSGYDIQSFLEGAKEMDEWTREKSLKKNPAALLSAMWYRIGKGKGEKDMVILPYKDRLELFSRYLQQLVMESLGKERDLKGKKVNQGIAVYGNKGSTDQHAYVQQLREGLNNFFVVFLEVKKSREGASMAVDPGVTSGEYLEGFYLGTRKALYDKGRQSVSVTIDQVDERQLGRLIALFERAVGFYAHYVDINAYHQPGVEAGKVAAQAIIDLKQLVVADLAKNKGASNCEELAARIGCPDEAEHVFKLLDMLRCNPGSGVKMVGAYAGTATRFAVN